MSELKQELKEMLLTECNLRALGISSPDEIADDDVLFGGGQKFGFDSIDYLQICMVLSVRYKVKINIREYQTTFFTVLRDINMMAAYVAQHRGEIE